jgi:ribosomal protein S12 methylthiotransferase accessory factor
MHRLNSSLREVPLTETLSRAKALSKHLGITRITNITCLDRIGIPVFASIRPDACCGSLCVNAGKGLAEDEARTGAFMEAIEFAIAESKRRIVGVFTATPRSIASQPGATFEFIDLCPVLGIPVDPDGPLDCVTSEDIITGESISVPAELAFSPFTENSGQTLFGNTTNGLSSGNTILEATLHGLAEVMERDVQSFNYVREASFWVDFDDDHTPRAIKTLLDLVRAADLEVAVRYTPNVFDMAYFQAFILEPSDEVPVAISQGYGFHPVREIAAVRALTEAAQSRLTYIHGGRDDLIDRVRFFRSQLPGVERAETARLRARASDKGCRIGYRTIPDQTHHITCVSDAVNLLVKSLSSAGIKQILRVTLSQPDSALGVVKVIVPTLEFFEYNLRRAGRRLHAYLMEPRGESIASPLRRPHTRRA